MLQGVYGNQGGAGGNRELVLSSLQAEAEKEETAKEEIQINRLCCWTSTQFYSNGSQYSVLIECLLETTNR